MQNAEQKVRERLTNNGRNPANNNAGIRVGSDLHLCEMLLDEIGRLRAIIDRLLTAGNHIATYRTDRWPDYKLDGLTREEQCENALRALGATINFDMWCCWSAIMQVRDSI